MLAFLLHAEKVITKWFRLSINEIRFGIWNRNALGLIMCDDDNCSLMAAVTQCMIFSILLSIETIQTWKNWIWNSSKSKFVYQNKYYESIEKSGFKRTKGLKMKNISCIANGAFLFFYQEQNFQNRTLWHLGLFFCNFITIWTMSSIAK